MSGEQKTGKTLHRLKIEGDYLDACRNRVWIDDVETTTVTKVLLTSDATEVNRAIVEFLLLGGLEVDTVAEMRVGEDTAQVLTALGWVSPERIREAVAKGEISINAARAFHGLPPFEMLDDGPHQSVPPQDGAE